ncbi:MAG TPA: hypothetical protein VFN30_04590 [Chitinophagaceae bacterium]|nr:hypothetical protein [Chitinophagaceae bacterium]
MKKILSLLAGLIFLTGSFSQSYKLTWGNEIKLKKGTTDMDIISVDNTGLYFTEAHLQLKSYFVIGATLGTAQKLIKFDKNYNEVFEKEYKKELKNVAFHSFQALGNDLFFFATDYLKKEKVFKTFGARLDKNTGNMMGGFTELGSYELESRRDDYEMRMKPIRNGKNFLLVANISSKDRVVLGVSILDNSLKKVSSTIIRLNINSSKFRLEDVVYTMNNKIVILGKEFEEVQVRRRKRNIFKQYIMKIYDENGGKETDIKLANGDRFTISGKMIEQPNGGLLLAGFYSNTSKKEDINGFFINKVDDVKGELLLSSFKEINSGSLGKNFDEDDADVDDEIKAEKKRAQKAKDDDNEDEFPNEYVIKAVEINPSDNSVLIISEISNYTSYVHRSSSSNNLTNFTSFTTTRTHKFTNEDILIINADKDGKIKWVNDIPKSQLEIIVNEDTQGSGISLSYDYSSFFAEGGGLPYYSSFVNLIFNNKLLIILNDHEKNTSIAKPGDRVKRVINFKKNSNVYGITIDIATGSMSKKIITANNADAILMPRQGYVINNEVVIPSWRVQALGKTKLKFVRLTIK